MTTTFRTVAAWFITLLLASGAASGEQVPDPELREVLREAINSADSFDDRYEAAVWLTDMSARLAAQVPNPDERMHILKRVHHEASKLELPPNLVLAVIEVESNFDRWAVSVAGALGLMQVMPFWLEELDQPQANLFQLRTNLRIGTTILRYYLDRERGDLRRALARYNGSLGEDWYPNRVFRALNQRWAP